MESVLGVIAGVYFPLYGDAVVFLGHVPLVRGSGGPFADLVDGADGTLIMFAGAFLDVRRRRGGV